MRFLLILLATYLASTLPVSAQQNSIDSFITSQMKEQRIMGLSVGIVKNGKIIQAKGYGQANIELNSPASEKTVYKIGSLSKQFVAVAIMKLVQEGKLNVSDPISKYILSVPASWKAITIRHLLNHTSGLPADPPGFDGMKEVPDSIYIKAAFANSLAAAPGAKYEYSNLGYFILADIIRIRSGMSFTDYMKKNIFDELGLTNTRTTSLAAIIPDRAAGYIKDSNNQYFNAANWVALRPSGAFLSTINDLLKWELAMQNNKLLAPSGWTRMWNDTIKTPLTMDGEIIYYTYGWMTNKVNGKQFIHHGGSLPGFKSAYFRYPEQKTAIIVLTNSDSADAYGIAFGIRDLLGSGN